jgi:hypothetical protein
MLLPQEEVMPTFNQLPQFIRSAANGVTNPEDILLPL